jgi:2-polyprenyl-3-methyl-5-hydroxy-6-metoxy-1,4-benzoquinol methylase
MPDAPLFHLDNIFDDDYLYFYENVLSAERTASEIETVWRLLSLKAGDRVLDLGCGHGRITNGLAQRGAEMTGLDRSTRFLKLAKSHAERLDVKVHYVQGDMREILWREEFDAVLCWFTTFGYFSDTDNQTVLHHAFRALRPGGRLLVEQINRYGLVRHGGNAHHVTRRGDDLLLDTNNYDGLTDRVETERLMVRNGVTRSTRYAVRLYGFNEMLRILSAFGASRVEAFGSSGQPFTLAGSRLITLAVKA